MAPAARNKVTKTPTKSPKASTPKSSPNKHTPTQAMSALTEDINARILWFVLSEFLNAGQTINYEAVASKMGISKNAAKSRFHRLKAAFEQDKLTAEDGKNESDEVKTEPRADTPDTLSSQETLLAAQEETMESA